MSYIYRITDNKLFMYQRYAYNLDGAHVVCEVHACCAYTCLD